MKKILLVLFILITIAGAYALTANLIIVNTNGPTLTFQCQAVDFSAETYDWDVGFGPGHFVAYDILNHTVTYTFKPGEQGRASCTAWDQQTGEVGVSEIYFDVDQSEGDLHDVSFRGCSEVWIVFDTFEGPIQVTIQTSAGPVSVTIEEEDLTKIPGQYGQKPLYKWNVHDNIGDEKILGVTVNGESFTNTNTCAAKTLASASSARTKGKK